MSKLPFLAKSPTFGNVIFHSEDQYAVLGKVPLHGKVVILGKIAFLGKVAAVVIDSILLVSLLVVLVSSPSLHPHCCQHRAGIFNLVVMAPFPLLRWRCPPFVVLASCPITMLLGVHGSTLRVLLLCSSCPARPCHRVASSSSSTSSGPDMPNALPVWRHCWLR